MAMIVNRSLAQHREDTQVYLDQLLVSSAKPSYGHDSYRRLAQHRQDTQVYLDQLLVSSAKPSYGHYVANTNTIKYMRHEY